MTHGVQDGILELIEQGHARVLGTDLVVPDKDGVRATKVVIEFDCIVVPLDNLKFHLRKMLGTSGKPVA